MTNATGAVDLVDALQAMPGISRALACGDYYGAYQLLREHCDEKDLPPGTAGRLLRELKLTTANAPKMPVDDPGDGRYGKLWRERYGIGRPLSAREEQVLALAAGGRSLEETAGELYLSIETVKTHRKGAIHKLGALNTTHAVAIWLGATRGEL